MGRLCLSRDRGCMGSVCLFLSLLREPRMFYKIKCFKYTQPAPL